MNRKKKSTSKMEELEDMMEIRMEETVATLHRLPPVKVQGFISSWPPIVREYWEAYGWDHPKLHLGPPSGESIDKMDECLDLLRSLDPDDMRLVWSRAENLPWKLILRRLGVSRATGWRRWKAALRQLATQLIINSR